MSPSDLSMGADACSWDWSWFKSAESVHGNLEFQTVVTPVSSACSRRGSGAEEADVSQTLPYPPNHFGESSTLPTQVLTCPDVVHVKCLLTTFPQYAALIERLAVVLRPGGMLVLVESEEEYVSYPAHSCCQQSFGVYLTSIDLEPVPISKHADLECVSPRIYARQRWSV